MQTMDIGQFSYYRQSSPHGTYFHVEASKLRINIAISIAHAITLCRIKRYQEIISAKICSIFFYSNNV